MIVGGTRFTGKATVDCLIEQGHDLTVLSRSSNIPEKVSTSIKAEREEGIRQLENQVFDITIDFICSGADDVNHVYENVNPGLYIMISTVWLAKEAFISGDGTLSKITERYLNAKKNAEDAIVKKRNQGCSAISLRLPILSGINDHTKRLLFYLERVRDLSGLILVNGGTNRFQIANSQDVALAISKVVSLDALEKYSVWDAMPDYTVSVKEIVEFLSEKHKVRFYDIPEESLRLKLPEYLEAEPFWREKPLKGLEQNIFKLSGVKARSIESWLSEVSQTNCQVLDSPLRVKELEIIK